MSDTPERFLWAAKLMRVQPADTVLEIGCGAGLLAEQIASRLSTGHLTAIDRSAAMIAKAQKRNQRFIDAGTARFMTGEFSTTKLPEAHFNSIVAFNVNFFWKDGTKELNMIRHCLQPKGRLYVFYQAPYEIDANAAKPIEQQLKAHSFSIADTMLKKMVPTAALCIVAQP
jgi:ubiquinone/menaquinone biosynthesis C-methylase UbiE